VTPNFVAAVVKSGRGGKEGTPSASFNCCSVTPNFVAAAAKSGRGGRAGLKEQGFVVDYWDNGDEGYLRALDNEYDAIILDIMVPGKDGLSILKQLRQKGRNAPVILLTARNELDDRLQGLNLGADDYIAKPFFVEELAARIHAVVRRSVGDLTLDSTSNGQTVLTLTLPIISH
jgi:DNA-binding response OmpR family regulator